MVVKQSDSLASTDTEVIVWRDLATLRKWDENYNIGDVKAVAASIAKFGFGKTLRIWMDPDLAAEIVVAGNTSFSALVMLKEAGQIIPHGIRVDEHGHWWVACNDMSYLNRAEARAFAIADNHTQERSTQDEEQLARILDMIRSDDPSLIDATGYESDDLQRLLSLIDLGGNGAGGMGGDAPDAQLDKADELQAIWQVKEGDLWVIPSADGKNVHKLVCGDCTSASILRKLMGDEKGELVWTDPPYGVSYVGKTEDALTIENDGSEGLDELLKGAFASVDMIMMEGCAIYIAHPAGALSITFGIRFLAQGWRLHETLAWVKDSMVLGHSDYHYKHEPIYFGYKQGGGRRGRGAEGWYGDDSQTTVLEFARPKASELHPTMKPIDLIVYCIGNSSRMNGIVIDPFCGSGSTLVACESSHRSGRGVELAPKYCAVILQRLKDMGLTPKREIEGVEAPNTEEQPATKRKAKK